MKKKSKKGKKRVTIKKSRIILLLAIVCAITIFILRGTDDNPRLTGAMKVFDRYVEALNESNYDEMYEMLSESTKKSLTKEDFKSRHEEIYGQIEASQITVSNMKEEQQDNRKSQSHIYKQDGNNCRNINICK